MKSWTLAIEGIQKLPEKAVRGTVLAMFGRIVQATPVGNPSDWPSVKSGKRKPPKGYVGGRLRNNWQITLNTPATSQLGPDKNGSAATATIQNMNAFEGGQTIFITNNMPYAERVEYGWSQQAPNGMVRIELARIEQTLLEAVKKL